MKRIIIGACMAVALALGTTSCGCGEKCAVNNDSIVATELSDSINTCLGMYAGMDFGSRIKMMEKDGLTVNRKEFVKGIKFIVSREYDKDFRGGVEYGLELDMTIDNLKNSGVEINRDDILRETRKYIMDEEVKSIEMNAAQLNFEKLMTRLETLGDKEIAAEMNDSINTYLGMYAGMDLSRRLTMMAQQNITTNRQNFLKGFQFIVAQNYDASYRDGVQYGLGLAMTLDHFNSLGVDTDRDVVMAEVSKYVNADSIDMTEMNKTQVAFEKLMNRLETVSTNRDRMRAGLEPVDDATAQAASATNAQSLYDREMTPGNTMTIDTGDGNTMSAVVKQSPSGLIYAIFDEGTGEKIGQQTQAMVQYRGMHADGSAFDEGETTFAPVQVIPGFGEGLMMLGKGGKAMFRIPGELGYGPKGVPQAGIQPNETLYFMVAVLDIK